MKIDAERLGNNIQIITLAGRMDIQGTQEIDLKFSGYTANQTSVIVDMSAVDFLTSIGIRTLLQSAKAVSNRNGKMVLLNPDASVTHILEMAGIDTLIQIHRSIEDARKAVTS